MHRFSSFIGNRREGRGGAKRKEEQIWKWLLCQFIKYCVPKEVGKKKKKKKNAITAD